MDHVRPFTPADLHPVADLFQKVFRRSTAPAPESLRTYLADLYLHNPWYDPDRGSLVYESKNRIAGFIGVLPWPLAHNGQPLRAGLGGNYMVDPDLRSPFAGARLLKAFLHGPHDLALSDTSSEVARKHWELQGGRTFPLYSLTFTRILRPSRLAATILARSRYLRPLVTAGRPLWALLDAAAARLPKHLFDHSPSTLSAGHLDTTTLLAALQRFTPATPLAPCYTEEGLNWLLGMARRKQEFGPLHQVALHAPTGDFVGWYLYYPNPGGTAQILQLAARPSFYREALRHLFHDAWSRGSLAVSGRVDPHHLRDLTALRCLFADQGVYVQARAQNEQLLAPLHAGTAFFTRLEGEWWTRLQGDTFE